ncbi:MAG: hypothetical protein IKM26_05125 [Clostridia bacterium]|nr:hypothetical protein [Clostridia bacterium]
MKQFVSLLLCLLLCAGCLAEAPAVFDPAWAGEEFNMPVPKPPFEQLQVQHPDDEMYMITALDPAEVGAVSDETVLAYIEQLKKLIAFDQINMEGFYLNRYDEPKYGFGAQTEEGIVVEFDLGRGGGKGEAEPGFIMVLVWPEEIAAEEVIEPALDSTVAMETTSEPETETPAEEKAELDIGNAEWTMEVITESNGSTYKHYASKNISQEMVNALVDYLKSRYTLYEEAKDEHFDFFGFENEETYGSLIINYQPGKERCFVDIFGDFAK